MTTQLASILSEFQAISERATNLVERVGPAAVAVRPKPEQWSVAECLAHLQISADAYLPIWRTAYAEAHASGLRAKAPFKMDLWGRFFVWFLEPPPKLRFRAPEAFRPIDAGPPNEVLPTFLASQDRLLSAIADADGLALDRIIIRSPFDRRVKYSAWSSFRANAAHHRRHLWQAERAADAIALLR